MTAQHILSRWRRVEPMLKAAARGESYTTRFSPVSMWLTMLCLAEEPDTVPAVAGKLKISKSCCAAMIRFLGKNGLAVVPGRIRQANGRSLDVWQATPKLFDVLAIQAPAAGQTETEGAV